MYTQKALKVVANSSYGFTGRKNGEMLCTAISETVTFLGRRLIDMTIEAVQTEFKEDAQVIYGNVTVCGNLVSSFLIVLSF